MKLRRKKALIAKISELEAQVAKLEKTLARSTKPQMSGKLEQTPKGKNNTGRVYTADEIALATLLREQGATYATIGTVLDRSTEAIKALFLRMGKNDPSVGRSRHENRWK